MTPTTTTADALDHSDPWGFGSSDAAGLSAAIEHFEPIDEPVDDDEPIPAALPGLSAQAEPLWPASAAMPMPAPAVERWIHLPFPRQMAGVLALFAAVIVAQAFYIGFSLTGEASARPDLGEMVVSSHPTGAQVRVDGHAQGTTPLVLPLAAGRHLLEVLGPAGEPEQFAADVVAGQRWTRHVVLARAAAPAARVAALKVDAGTSPAQVFVDGVLAGPAPFTQAGLSAGEHVVRVEFRTGAAVERTVTLPAGETVALVLGPPLARAAVPAVPAAGWVRVDAPFEVQVFRAGEIVGSSRSERIMLPAGPHVLELVNTALGYRAPVKTTVAAGKVALLTIDTPRVPVAINAQPWAEVIVDGRVHGDTPLANVMLPIGVHDVVLRHPEFGEHKETVTVRADGANRVSADLRR